MGKRTSNFATSADFEQAENNEQTVESCFSDNAMNPPVENADAEIEDNENSVVPVVCIGSYKKHLNSIKQGFESARKSFFKIAFTLEWFDSTGAYKLGGYKNIVDFAESNFDICSSTTYNYINVANRFGVRDADTGDITALQDKFKDFKPTQLIIMLGATDDEIDSLGINSTMTCATIEKLIKGLETIESSQSEEPADEPADEPAEKPTEEPAVEPVGKYSKSNVLMTINSLDELENCKNSIFELIKKTLSQDGFKCAVSINMEWD